MSSSLINSNSPSKTPTIVRVAFNVPINCLFDYKISKTLNPNDLLGYRVQAPFGDKNKQCVGLILKVGNDSIYDESKLKKLTTVFDDMPPLTQATQDLIFFCSDYYHCPIGRVVAAILPSHFRRAKTYKPPTGYCLLTDKKNSLEKHTNPESLTLIELLSQHKVLSLATIKAHMANPQLTLKKLIDSGDVTRCQLPNQLFTPPTSMDPPTILTQWQENICQQLKLNQGFVPHLLFGSTGSGKTEIYLQAMQAALSRQQQVLVLTPEIHLTPQLQERLARRFVDKQITVLHSHLSDGERAHRWLLARLGDLDIIIGTRLNIFTPLPRLGLIIIDEEHDESYQQEQQPTFCAKRVGLWRAHRENVPIILGSATPSLETYRASQKPSWQYLRLCQRVIEHNLTYQIIKTPANHYHGIGHELLALIKTHIKAKKQVLVFINRRGYAPILACRQCKIRYRCRYCHVNLTVHRRRDLLCCHLCGYSQPLDNHCYRCGNKTTFIGVGTQRIEEGLQRLFPSIQTLRLDSDSVDAHQFNKQRRQIFSGESLLLIGTRIISKGHNFPQLSLIVLINSDQAFNATDFKAEERAFALLSQVIGRGTRNPKGCHIAIQTQHPNHPFYRCLIKDDINTYWQKLLAERQQVNLPPFSYLAAIKGQDKKNSRLDSLMQEIWHIAKDISQEQDFANIQVFDPVPALIDKVGGYYRQQILIRAQSKKKRHHFLNQWIQAINGPLKKIGRWQIEIDPHQF